jgi:hypothetical protein
MENSSRFISSFPHLAHLVGTNSALFGFGFAIGITSSLVTWYTSSDDKISMGI